MAEATLQRAREARAATASQWLEDLPHETYFWGRDVPGKPSTARALLSRLAADESSAFLRVAHGLYWRGYPEGHPLRDRHWRRHAEAAQIYAGPGAGRAEWSAVHELAWAHQGSRYGRIAVVRRRLRPTEPWVRFVRRENLRRLELTWLEVSVLEALAWLEFVGQPWEQCLHMLASGISGRRVGGSGVFRPDRLAWAAETDDLATPALQRKAAQMQRELPEVIHPAREQLPVRVWGQ